MNKKIIIGNLKMNKGPISAHEYIHKLEYFLQSKKITELDFAIAVPFVTIPYVLPHHHDDVSETLNPIKIAAQNCFYELYGNYTGEISPLMLEELGVNYVLLGHSERRKLFNETDEIINKKVKSVLNNTKKLIPILIIGEEKYNTNNNYDELIIQLHKNLEGVKNSDKRLKELIIAYEPIWAVGTKNTLSADKAQDIIQILRIELKKMFSKNIADKIRILYGGSINENNLQSFLIQKDIDGVLVGNYSLDPEKFSKLLLYQK